MGTRGLLGLIVRGKRRGTYNQFDSYPEGLGAAIAEFLAALTEEDRLRMIERLDQVSQPVHILSNMNDRCWNDVHAD